jgi:hypothetical protein
VAPGGKLIADPKARNKAINAAYAQLWRLDSRFQWAGLAAFASKQVGCGLLHAAESVEKIRAEYEAAQWLKHSARQGLAGLLSPSEWENRAKVREFEQRCNNLVADLSDVDQRMAFVLRAAKQFDDLLLSDQRKQLEQSIRDIAWGGGVR